MLKYEGYTVYYSERHKACFEMYQIAVGNISLYKLELGETWHDFLIKQ